MSITQLKSTQLYNKCTLAKVPARLKKEPDAFTNVIGQETAERALLFAMQMKSFGYNAFCLGPKGIGKKNLTLQLLQKHAKTLPTPEDICFVQPLQTPHQARLLRLPAGKAPVFERDFQALLRRLSQLLPESLYTSCYLSGIQAIKTALRQEQSAYLTYLKGLAKGKKYVTIAPLDNGFCVMPVYKRKTIQPDAFSKLPQRIQAKAYAQMVDVRAKLAKALNASSAPSDEGKTAEFNQKYFTDVVQKAFTPLKYIDSSFFVDEIVSACLPVLTADSEETVAEKQKKCMEILQHYQINIVATHPARSGAPVVFMDSPATINKLFGAVEAGAGRSAEYRFDGGALYQANGGFFVCRVQDINESCLVRLLEVLKTLRLSPETTAYLKIPPVDLDLKVVLIGSGLDYNKLCEKYPDFLSLFKVMVPFVPSVPRNKHTEEQYAALLMFLATKYDIKPLAKNALERLIELSSRLCNNQNELSTCLSWLTTLMKEANYWAKDSATLQAKHIDQALQAEDERSNMMQKQILQRIKTQQLLLSVEGKEVGQVNVLYVMDGARFSYGRPARTTCRTRIGSGIIADVETKSQLGGNTYAKGITILQAFMAAQFGQTEPLCVDASVVLEQSYMPIDGDSASCAQLCALLSAIGQIPLSQSIAVTGSVNQLGQVQSVGSVNEKIEGFFDVCKGLGLSGTQGVIIPRPNACQLMLRADVVKAIEDGLFSVWVVDDVYDAMTILTGKTTAYINKQIRQRLHQYFVDSHKKPKK